MPLGGRLYFEVLEDPELVLDPELELDPDLDDDLPALYPLLYSDCFSFS